MKRLNKSPKMSNDLKNLIIIFVSFGIVLVAGIILFAIGQGMPSMPLVIAGEVTMVIGFIPTIIISIILYFKQPM